MDAQLFENKIANEFSRNLPYDVSLICWGQELYGSIGINLGEENPVPSNHIEVHGDKIHYVDIGEGDPILFLSPFARCIAPDLIGMGKSDKPDIEYRFFDHISALLLKFCQKKQENF